MLTINKIFPQEKIPEKTESFLFFDIETTGFSRDNTILYLIADILQKKDSNSSSGLMMTAQVKKRFSLPFKIFYQKKTGSLSHLTATALIFLI